MRLTAVAVRWHSHFCGEMTGVSLAHSGLLLAALSGLTRQSPAVVTVAEVCERYGLDEAARVAEAWG